MKTDPYYQRQKCRPMTLLSGFMLIFAEVPWGDGVKRQCGSGQRQFLAFSLAVSLDTLEIKPSLLYSVMQSVVGFSLIPKCVWPWMTLNGYFALSSVFEPLSRASDRVSLRKYCVKTNKDRHILSAAQILDRDYTLVSGRIRFGGSLRGSLEKRRRRTGRSRVNARLEHLFLAFENNYVKVNTDRPTL